MHFLLWEYRGHKNSSEKPNISREKRAFLSRLTLSSPLDALFPAWPCRLSIALESFATVKHVTPPNPWKGSLYFFFRKDTHIWTRFYHHREGVHKESFGMTRSCSSCLTVQSELIPKIVRQISQVPAWSSLDVPTPLDQFVEGDTDEEDTFVRVNTWEWYCTCFSFQLLLTGSLRYEFRHQFLCHGEQTVLPRYCHVKVQCTLSWCLKLLPRFRTPTK
jgi:hypothetical protein